LKDAFQQNAKKFEDKAKEKDKLVVKIDTLKKTLEKKGAFAGTCRSKKAALDEQLGSITTEYELKRMLSNQLMLRYQAEKKELKTKQEEMSDLDVKLKKLQEEIIEMESQVIKSPEKIREEVIKQEGLLTVKSGEKRQLNSEYSAIVAQTENIDLAAQDMIPLMDHIKETITDMDAFKVKCSAVDDIKENITAKELKVQQQKVIIKQNSCNVMDMKDQIKKAVSKHGIRMKPMNTLLHEINEQIKKREDASSGPSKELVMKEKSLHQEIENIKDERAKLEQLIITMNERVAATHKKVEKQLRGNQG
jgi:chromosome segregation ATPase